MKKTHRLMIPILVVISISALLGASVIAEKPEEHPDHPDHPEHPVCPHPLLEGETCDCFYEDPEDPGICGEPPGSNEFTPLCCRVCGGWCLGAHLGRQQGKRADQSLPWNK